MSCQLFWRPIGSGRSAGGSRLRYAVEKRFGVDVRLDESALEFLRGLEAAGVEGATDLIEAIEKHEEIEIYLDC